MNECHQHFLDNWETNKKTIQQKTDGSWRVYCAHCMEPIGGEVKHDSCDFATVLWSSAKAWFGTFVLVKYN